MTFDPATFAGYHQGPTYGFDVDIASGFPSDTADPTAYFPCHTKPFFVEYVESCLAASAGPIDTLMTIAEATRYDATVGSYVRLGDADPQPDWIAVRVDIGYTSVGYSPSCIAIGNHDQPQGGCAPLVHIWSHQLMMVVTTPDPADHDPDGFVRPGDFISDTDHTYPGLVDDETNATFASHEILGWLKRSQTLGTGFTGDPGNDASVILWRPDEIVSVTDHLSGHWHEIHSQAGHQSLLHVLTFYPGDVEPPPPSDELLMLVV